MRGCSVYGLKSFRKGPSLRSLAASVKARNLLKPVVAAPLPRAAARVRTSSRDAIGPPAAAAAAEAAEPAAATAAVVEGVDAGSLWLGGGAEMATVGAVDGCVMAGLCLLNSSSMACWSAFFKPCAKPDNSLASTAPPPPRSAPKQGGSQKKYNPWGERRTLSSRIRWNSASVPSGSSAR